jgi:hypothetical protein
MARDRRPGNAIRVPEALTVLAVGYDFQPSRTVDKARETALRKLRTYVFFFVLPIISISVEHGSCKLCITYSMEQSPF